MFTFVVVAIMVIDIAALIYPTQPVNTRCIDRMLTPSQVRTAKFVKGESFADGAGRKNLIPSQVIRARLKKGAGTKMSTHSSEVHDFNHQKKIEVEKSQRRIQRSDEKLQNRGVNSRPRREKSTRSNNIKTRRRRKLNSGNLPDVFWRSIPLEHVRKHPLFLPLPDPKSIVRIESMEDVRFFRQESWQWDVLHEGRMTTSQALAALGFLEPRTGKILGVPKGLRRGGEGAYHRLRKPARTRTLEEINENLCLRRDDVTESKSDGIIYGNDNDCGEYWTQPANFPFAAKYMVQTSEEEYQNRRDIAADYMESKRNHWSIRMVWGNVQEATSLLTALNYFWNRDKRVLMKEVGMCGAGLEFNQTSHSIGLILGATPDAILCHPDGKIEAVEVKNHCPFYPSNGIYTRKKNKGSKQSDNNAFRLAHNVFSKTDTIMCQYIPQLMLEMLCLGEQCVSAIMVRQTATSGSLILRIKRDNEWIKEMLYYLNRFYEEFVQQGIPPPQDFFLEDSDPIEQARYKRFLEFTKRIESEVELLEHVPNRSIQRATANFPCSMDLFLDEV